MTKSLELSDWIAIVSLIVAIAALVVAAYAIVRGNKNASAATLIALNVAFRDAWEQYLFFDGSLSEDRTQFYFAELMNLFEIACAIYQEDSMTGVSGELLRNYMQSILHQLVKSPAAKNQVPALLTEPTTFKHIKLFLDDKLTHPSITVPPEWYQSYARPI